MTLNDFYVYITLGHDITYESKLLIQTS